LNVLVKAMADHCCQNKASALTQLKERQARVLWVVLAINLVMFVVEFWAGLRAASLSLTGDSLDMLGDALVYGTSLYVIHRSAKALAGAALLKGVIMFAFAIAVFARAIYQFAAGIAPTAEIMGSIGLLALVANLICLLLLARHRQDNLNMSSVWLCSRNDIIANTSVVVAAGLVFLTQSPIPDLLVGLLLTVVFARSAATVLSQSWRAIA
jgi:Co/Zn/Cd efflux system component